MILKSKLIKATVSKNPYESKYQTIDIGTYISSLLAIPDSSPGV